MKEDDKDVNSEPYIKEPDKLLDGLTPDVCKAPEDKEWLDSPPEGREIL